MTIEQELSEAAARRRTAEQEESRSLHDFLLNSLDRTEQELDERHDAHAKALGQIFEAYKKDRNSILKAHGRI